jgi:small-conductance mechanosensitive channel
MNTFKASLLSVWLGAALFFSAVVAPAVFGILREVDPAGANEIAGKIVSRTLGVINISGFVIGSLLLLLTIALRKSSRLMFAIQTVLLLVLMVSTAAGKWIVVARMNALRMAMSAPMDHIAIDDPRRIAFAQLHGYSVALLSAAMLAALIGIVVLILKSKSPATKSSKG